MICVVDFLLACWPQMKQGDECGGLAEFESSSSVNYSFSNFSFKVFFYLVRNASGIFVCLDVSALVCSLTVFLDGT